MGTPGTERVNDRARKGTRSGSVPMHLWSPWLHHTLVPGPFRDTDPGFEGPPKAIAACDPPRDTHTPGQATDTASTSTDHDEVLSGARKAIASTYHVDFRCGAQEILQKNYTFRETSSRVHNVWRASVSSHTCTSFRCSTRVGVLKLFVRCEFGFISRGSLAVFRSFSP